MEVSTWPALVRAIADSTGIESPAFRRLLGGPSFSSRRIGLAFPRNSVRFNIGLRVIRHMGRIYFGPTTPPSPSEGITLFVDL